MPQPYANVIPSSIGRRYDRLIPDPLPPSRMLTRVSPSLPAVVDLEEWCGPVKDQGNIGSCTGHAFASSLEWILRKYFNKSPILSPLYLYSKELQANGSFPQDVGSDGTTGCEVSIANGCCEDSFYPDASQQIIETTPEMDANAALYRMGAYHGLAGSQVALSVLGDPVPWPVQIGFTVYESFESDYTASTGIMVIPKAGEKVLGGHEPYIIGYDVGPVPVIRPAACPPAVKVRNSWSVTWGLKGNFWMPTEILDQPDSDTKILHSGAPWKMLSGVAAQGFSART
jgi:C1A family cysteine protease